MVSGRRKSSKKDRAPQVAFTNRKAVELVKREAELTGETVGGVAARCVISYFAISRKPILGDVT